MIFKDRKVPYPNRVKLTKIPNETDLYNIERAEGVPNVEGTPLNAATFNQFRQEITESLKQDIPVVLRDLFYPTGTIYLSLKNISPASFIGGNWVELNAGPYLRIGVATEDSGYNGGSSTIMKANLPAHCHSVTNFGTGTSGTYPMYRFGYVYTQQTQNATVLTENTGDGENYYPVFKNVYAWRRIA